MRNWVPALAISICLALPCASRAQTALLFDTAHLAAVEPGSTLTYAVSAVRTDAETGEGSEHDGEIRIAATQADDPDRRTMTAEITRDGRNRSLDAFRSVSGNPVFIIFLEQITQDLARATGGSTFYLRNRLRSGLGEGLTQEVTGNVTRLVMHPFAGDPNAEGLGPYVNLEVAFELDNSVPGMFQELSAKAGPDDAPVFLEQVTYDPEG